MYTLNYSKGWNRSTSLPLNICLKTHICPFNLDPYYWLEVTCCVMGGLFLQFQDLPYCTGNFSVFLTDHLSLCRFLDPEWSNSWDHPYFFSFYFSFYFFAALSVGRQQPFRPFPAEGNFSIFGFPIISLEPSPCLYFAVSCFFKTFGLTLCLHPGGRHADSLNSPTVVTSCSVSGGTVMRNFCTDSPAFNKIYICFSILNGVFIVFLSQPYQLAFLRL